MAGVEGLEPPTHGLEIGYVPYPLFGINDLVGGLARKKGSPDVSMHPIMHPPE